MWTRDNLDIVRRLNSESIDLIYADPPFNRNNLEVDHVIPRAKGGSDHLDNLQLLGRACNRAKGLSTQAELIAKLKERGHLAA